MATALESLAPPLDWIAAGVEDSGWAAELCDADWRLVWVSSQERALLGNASDEELGVGLHILESHRAPFWDRVIDDLDQKRWLELNVPQMLVDTPAEELVELLPDFAELIESAEPAALSIWTDVFRVRTGVSVMEVRYFATRIRTPEGQPVGTVYLYGSSLPATLLTLVTAGNRAMFERMARLITPGRRAAAVLFADVEASGALSRRLSSAAYFDLIRRLTTAMDALVIDRDGIVGKHAGDGVTAFFLAEDLGSPSAAAFACLDTARALSAVARETAAMTDQVDPSELRMNVGVHWGSTLYMGQVVTGGRLEVTALGDEVNECARLEQAASGGEVLASKSLVEQLSVEDAAKLGLDVERAAYTAVADLPGISDKVMRDAGTIAVTRLRS